MAESFAGQTDDQGLGQNGAGPVAGGFGPAEGSGSNGAGPVSAEGAVPDIRTMGMNLITAGINASLAELKELSIGWGYSAAGKGFSELALNGLDIGHSELTDVFKSFCERWDWGVRDLIAEGNHFAESVGLSAGTMHQVDQYVSDAAKVVANAGIGNPMLSEEQAANQSWNDLVKENHALADPNYSPDSFAHAQETSRQALRDAGRDAVESPFLIPFGGAEAITRESGSEHQETLDRWFGTSPEERAANGETMQRVSDPTPTTAFWGAATNESSGEPSSEQGEDED
ncbi:hypothetical protein HUT18_21270 [Streptomyces sp. NA04227]|uniref:hypothetical protein n=1 Tax=Streptomyces sp. NA04227 TaxID=2742136 RepID=UPI00159277B9|nr:hypothetical protein [Streptomyces sp. NA04227]QKW08519.1 hypothetical protein HUT18_21270 [Streptomyces sp. NA04227]